MQVMFSATEQGDEELTSQVAGDIEDAKKTGAVDTDEVSYISLGEGKVMIIDKANGECTIAEVGNDDSSSYDLIAVPTDEMDKFLHPQGDGVTPNYAIPDHEDEDAWAHAEGGIVSPEVPGDTVNHEAGYEQTVMDNSEREFSVSTDNTVVLRVFSDQEFCERIFAEVVESEDTAVVGNLKVEKVDEDTVIVTDTASGDQAKVELSDDNMEVTELEEKDYSDLVDEDYNGQYEPVYVVGIDTINNQIVDSPVFDPEDAQDLAAQLSEIGVEGVNIFETPEEARDYADSLLGEVGVSEVEQLAEPEQAEFSDHTVYVTRYFSSYEEDYNDVTNFMARLFSETEGNCECQESVEDAIESGEQVEDDHKIITPVDARTAVIEDKENGEFTKATLEGDSIDVEKISEDEASDLTEGLATEDEDAKAEEEAEKAYAIASMTDFEYRLYSEDEAGSIESEEKVKDAIESGEQIETAAEIITPVDAETAVVEDKDSGEFTKVTMDDEGLETEEISESEASDLTEDLAVSDKSEAEEIAEAEKEAEEEEKKYSYTFEAVTSYMQRLYSGDEDQTEIEDAIESGESVEDSDKKITPVDSHTAVIEDKETGEFTKATIENDDDLNVEAISEDEASDLLEDLAEEETEEETEEREYSEWIGSDTLGRFFSDAMAPQGAPAPGPQSPEEAAMMEQQMAQEAAMAQGGADPIQSVENIEDKALVAVQSIQDAANQAVQAIQQAKEAPVPGQEMDLQEAQFSQYYDYDLDDERYYTSIDEDDTLSNWLAFK